MNFVEELNKPLTREEILTIHGPPRRVGPDGHVRLVDFMGGDDAVVQAARVSYGAGTKQVQEDRQLIRYLMRHRHSTPFEMVTLKFHIRIPMDAWRQMIRHRTASVNEYSTRYSEAIDSRATTDPGNWRLQSANNKQGSSGLLDSWTGQALTKSEQELHDLSHKVYQERLAAGVAREQARKDLPLSTYTEAYWEMDLHNLFHFLRLRLHPHAQLEIREFAQAIYDVVKDVAPVSAEAFEDYSLGGQFFSREEMEAIHYWLEHAVLNECALTHPDGDDCNLVNLQNISDEARKAWLSKFIGTQRERQEFWSKIND